MNHKVRVVEHLMVGLFKWIEDALVKTEIKMAKEKIQDALKPSQVLGGSRDQNVGKAHSKHIDSNKKLMLVR